MDSLDARLKLFPVSTKLEYHSAYAQLAIAGCRLAELADLFGTPLYLYDRASLDQVVSRYRNALRETYPGSTSLTYAGKAFLCLAMAQWVKQTSLCLDCSGSGELEMARIAGIERQRLLVHGVNKSPAELERALRLAGTIVVDNLTELERIAAMSQDLNGLIPDLWLRLRPGVRVDTHPYIQTGMAESKFGMSLPEGRRAVEMCLEHGLPLTGLHFHLGSNFHEAGPVEAALAIVLKWAARIRSASGWQPLHLSPGGGLGIAYHESELPHPVITDFVRPVAQITARECRSRGLELPRLHLEPGRSLVAQAGVALYRVGAVKASGERRWLLLDGGLADNPRPALYRARYTALPVLDPQRPNRGPAWLAGPSCENGDVLIEGLALPDIQPGELLAVPMSGAYQLGMSSNYNGACRPAVVWLEGGKPRLIQRRERPEDLLDRDIGLF